jgi:hypothetical protein
METLSVSIEELLYRFLEEHGDNQVKRDLLAFLGRHPNAKFARYIICRVLDYGKLEVGRALRALVDARIVDDHTNNGLTLYSLTTDEEKRRPVLELAALGWDQWQFMLKRIELKKQSS